VNTDAHHPLDAADPGPLVSAPTRSSAESAFRDGQPGVVVCEADPVASADVLVDMEFIQPGR
jgi:hypothetical protein